MTRTGLLFDPLFLRHDPGSWHPESPARLQVTWTLLQSLGLLDQVEHIQARAATREEICRVHLPTHYERVARTEGKVVALDPDTTTSADSFRAAALAAGGIIVLCERLLGGDLENGLALVRPPGHHAETGRAMGFCLFNSVAVAAAHVLASGRCRRVLIVDWDLHHGNGTQQAFYDRRDVMYFSTHQYPYYPGTGGPREIGEGEGLGYTVNVPLPTGMGDREYVAIFRDLLAPLARAYQPDLILASVGFDTYRADPLGGMKMSVEGYGMLTFLLKELAQELCGGRLALVLEGGYHLEGMSQGTAACLRVLLGQEAKAPFEPSDRGQVGPILEAVMQLHAGMLGN